MLHCNGKCLLAKKLKQEEKKDQQNPGRKLDGKNEVISSCSVLAENFSFAPINKRHYCIYSEKDTIDLLFLSFTHLLYDCLFLQLIAGSEFCRLI